MEILYAVKDLEWPRNSGRAAYCCCGFQDWQRVLSGDRKPAWV